MGNPFLAAMNGGNSLRSGNKRNLAPALLQHIQGFQGNPVQELQNKLNSVGATQEQYNQLYSAAQDIAQQMMGVLGRK